MSFRLAGVLAMFLAGISDAQQAAPPSPPPSQRESSPPAPVSARVLLVGAHPDDEDTGLIAWLARGRGVETAYLSLTRGDGGQNLIGNELGEALGVIRTQELLAARRIDGAHQFFTRAYDFGYSKSAAETFMHWPREELLGDVVKIVRAFRPDIVVAFFAESGGHGQHQVSAILARQAYDVSSDTVRFPVRTFGRPWTPLKFYRTARFAPAAAT
ncbi:MAG: PIG-L family deacetylase, partial [Gemmatimonadaceae bacterium]